MSATPAGWYDDGQHPGQQRWWDGAQWTDQFQPVPGPAATPAAATLPAEAVPTAQPPEDDTPPFRLLPDEAVLGTFPITRKRRPLGTLSSTLFVTDVRVVYAARAKSALASSVHLKEFRVASVTGVEVGRSRGLDALGIVAGVGAVLNFLGLVILAILVAAATSGGGYSYGGYSIGNPLAAFGWLGWVFGLLAVASLVAGAAVVFVLSRSSAVLKVVGPSAPQTLAQQFDLVKFLVTLVLFALFGAFAGTAVVLWALIRELGAFRAADAERYADAALVDRIAHEVGALILDVNARGKDADAVE